MSTVDQLVSIPHFSNTFMIVSLLSPSILSLFLSFRFHPLSSYFFYLPLFLSFISFSLSLFPFFYFSIFPKHIQKTAQNATLSSVQIGDQSEYELNFDVGIAYYANGWCWTIHYVPQILRFQCKSWCPPSATSGLPPSELNPWSALSGS